MQLGSNIAGARAKAAIAIGLFIAYEVEVARGFGRAALHEAREPAATAVGPAHKLVVNRRVGAVLAHFTPERRAVEPSDAHIEGERRECVPLALRGRDTVGAEQVGELGLYYEEIVGKECFGLLAGDYLPAMGGAGVAVAYGPHAGWATIRLEAQSLPVLNHTLHKWSSSHVSVFLNGVTLMPQSYAAQPRRPRSKPPCPQPLIVL